MSEELKKYLESLSSSVLQALKDNNKRLEEIGEEFKIPARNVRSQVEDLIDTAPRGLVPPGADLEELEAEQVKMEDDFFNEKDEESNGE